METRVISLDKGSQLNKTVISYTDLKEVTPIVAGIVIHKENPTGYSFDSNAGYIAYADSTQNPRNNNGVIYVGAVFPASLNAAKAQLFPEAERKEHGGSPLDMCWASATMNRNRICLLLGSRMEQIWFCRRYRMDEIFGEFCPTGT